MTNAHQLNRYIIYTCNKCQWKTAIVAEWGDLKPKMCQNAKCRCSFIREPKMLDIKKPSKVMPKAKAVAKKPAPTDSSTEPSKPKKRSSKKTKKQRS